MRLTQNRHTKKEKKEEEEKKRNTVATRIWFFVRTRSRPIKKGIYSIPHPVLYQEIGTEAPLAD
jgi:hypothetical protein